MVSAIETGLGSAEVRQDTMPTAKEAQARADFPVMSLAKGLRARSHEVAALAEWFLASTQREKP